MSKKCRAYSESKLGLEPADNRKAFYAGWEAALAQQAEPVTWYSVDQPLNYMTRCADGTEFINTVVMPAHAVSWAYTTPPQRPTEPVQEPDLFHCPKCGGPADNGHDRSIPPNPYLCTKCMEQPAPEPVAWRHKGAGHFTVSPLVSKFPEWEPLYTAPPRCPNCASLEAQNNELDRKLAEVEQEEREACAKLAESTICDTHLPTGVRIYGTRVAAAIRARSKE